MMGFLLLDLPFVVICWKKLSEFDCCKIATLVYNKNKGDKKMKLITITGSQGKSKYLDLLHKGTSLQEGSVMIQYIDKSRVALTLDSYIIYPSEESYSNRSILEKELFDIIKMAVDPKYKNIFLYSNFTTKRLGVLKMVLSELPNETEFENLTVYVTVEDYARDYLVIEEFTI